jgi:hypothetical protein
MTRFAVLLLADLCGLASGAQSQIRPHPPARHGELVFFSGAGFGGQAYRISGARPDLQVPFRVRSVLVAQGEAWQVCAGSSFRNPCTLVDDSRADRGLLSLVSIRSARPVGPTGDEGFAGSGFAGPSMRGMASEFFRAPESRGSRVLACGGGPVSAACAAQTATRFCRARGYGGSAFQQLETVRGRTYLADVLCSHAGV